MNESILIKPPIAIEQIEARSKDLDFGMASDPRTGALLATLASSKPGGRFLELGTGTGIATAWLLAGMDAASSLVSVDVRPEFQAVAKEILGRDPRLTLVIEDGIQFLHKQEPQSFDLVFADAMPGKYESLDEALVVVKPGGFYIIDDMLPQPNWPEGHDAKATALIDRLSRETAFQVAPLHWSSGVILLVRRPEHA
ncbi:MAG: class I SAM-dependent methyltransferase [Acidobacteria bacterium]|nr:class I SAM-dependent methyltransferase [Acidobacteriota bacterium]